MRTSGSDSTAGAKGGTRTPRAFRLPDPKSGASANSATFAGCVARPGPLPEPPQSNMCPSTMRAWAGALKRGLLQILSAVSHRHAALLASDAADEKLIFRLAAPYRLRGR